MAKKSAAIPADLIASLSAETIDSLSNISQVFVSKFSSDTSSMILNGCVLLGISRVDNDEDGNGFRFLVGLPVGVEVTPYLAISFQR